MDYGNHLSALIAIIVGLAVTELLAGVSRALRAKGRPGFTWFPFVQAFLIATIILVFWLASFAELSSGKYLGVFAFSTQLAAPALLYFAATRVFPPADGDGAGLSLADHVEANARDVNIPPALWMAMTIAGNFYYFGADWRGAMVPNLMCLAAIVLLTAAAFTKQTRTRWAATLTTEAIVVTFIGAYLGR
jgi:hypothetical protein